MGKINLPDLKVCITTSMYGIGGGIDTKINGIENPKIDPTNTTMCEMLPMLAGFLKEYTKSIIKVLSSGTLLLFLTSVRLYRSKFLFAQLVI